MPMVPEILLPLVFKLNPTHRRDTATIILPPNYYGEVALSVPKGKALRNYGINIGKPRIYNPDLNDVGDVLISDEIGFYRKSTFDKLHDIPLVESVVDEDLGDFSLIGEDQYEYSFIVYNRTSYFVILSVTMHMLEFPVELIEDIKRYFIGIADFFISRAGNPWGGESG